MWEGASPSHGRHLFEMLVQNTTFLCIKMLKFSKFAWKMNCMIEVLEKLSSDIFLDPKGKG